MKVQNKTVNGIGINEIREFLNANHKAGVADPDYFSESMLRAWAADAEAQLDEGNPACVELPSYKSIHGYTQELRISDAGIDVEEIEVDE